MSNLLLVNASFFLKLTNVIRKCFSFSPFCHYELPGLLFSGLYRICYYLYFNAYMRYFTKFTENKIKGQNYYGAESFEIHLYFFFNLIRTFLDFFEVSSCFPRIS